MSSESSQGATYIREVAVQYRGARLRATDKISQPESAVRFARKVVRDDAREHFLAIYLDSRQLPIAYQVVSIGSASQALVHPREIFQPGLLVGAASLVIMHSHPSGDPTPSPEDCEVTQRIARAGELLGIALLDHVVFTREGLFHSLVRSRPALFS